MTETVEKVARNLDLDDRLADGAIILTLSFQISWIYAKVASMTKPGTVTRRRYRYDQMVRVQA